jgi:hypothetical protein
MCGKMYWKEVKVYERDETKGKMERGMTIQNK